MKRQILKEFEYLDVEKITEPKKEINNFLKTLVGRYFLIEEIYENFPPLEAPDGCYSWVYITGIFEEEMCLKGITVSCHETDRIHKANICHSLLYGIDFYTPSYEERVYEIDALQFCEKVDDALNVINEELESLAFEQMPNIQFDPIPESLKNES